MKADWTKPGSKHSPYEDLDLLVGDVLLVSTRLYRVERFTPKRAYVHRVEGVGFLSLSGREDGSAHVLGSDRAGYYIEIEFDFQRRAVEREIKLRDIPESEIQARAHRARQAIKPHYDRVQQLLVEIAKEQEQERAARRKHLTEGIPAEDATT